MGEIRSNDEPSERMAKLMAKLYFFMASEIIKKLGDEEGKDVIRKAISRFGKSRAEAMLKEAEERDLEINHDTYLAVRDMPLISWKKDPCRSTDITYCPMHDMWSMLNDNELGSLYCEIDKILYESFSIDFDRPLCKTSGDPCCRFIIK